MRRVLLGWALAAAACSEQGPVSGELAVTIATPRASDRAVMFTVTGPQTGVTAAPGSGYFVYAAAGGGDTTRVVVVAPAGRGITAGEVARIAVADVRRIGSYGVRLSDVAAASYAVGDSAGVSLSVSKP